MNHSQAIEQLANSVTTNGNSIIRIFEILIKQSEDISELKKEIKQLKSKIK